MLDKLLTKLFILTCRKKNHKPSSYNQEYFQKGFAETKAFLNVFPVDIDIKQKDVLDFGSGYGSTCFYLALKGAKRVIGVDVNHDLINFAKNELDDKYPFLKNIIDFQGDHNTLINCKFDIVISKCTFEHVRSLDVCLSEISTILKKGGRLYAGVDPMWKSPFGGHGRLKTRLPWGHCLFPEKIILKGLSELNSNFNASTIADCGLNKLTLQDLKRAIRNSELNLLYFKINVGRSIIKKTMNCIIRIPFLKEYFSNDVYFILEKQ